MLLTGILKPPSFTFCRFLHASSQKLSKSLMVPNDHDHYEALEIPPDATLTEIREAFFKKAKAYHPDVNSTPEAKEKFLKIRESYKVLSNGKSRSVYDHQYTVVARPRRYVSDEEQLMIDTKKMIDQEVYLMTKHSYKGTPKKWEAADELGTVKSALVLNRNLDDLRNKVDEKREERKKLRKENFAVNLQIWRQKYPDNQLAIIKSTACAIFVLILLFLSVIIRKVCQIQ